MSFRELGTRFLFIGLALLWLWLMLSLLYNGFVVKQTAYISPWAIDCPIPTTETVHRHGSSSPPHFLTRPVQVTMKQCAHSTQFGVATPQPSFNSTSAPLLAMNNTSHSSTMVMPTTSSASVHEVIMGGGSTGGGSSSSSNSARGIQTTNVHVSLSLLTTSASQVGGGMTASQTYARLTGKRMSPDVPGEPDCPYCIDLDGDNICDRCGHDMLDGCECEGEHGYCWCPIEEDWTVWLFLTALSMGYIIYIRVRRKRTQKASQNEQN